MPDMQRRKRKYTCNKDVPAPEIALSTERVTEMEEEDGWVIVCTPFKGSHMHDPNEPNQLVPWNCQNFPYDEPEEGIKLCKK